MCVLFIEIQCFASRLAVHEVSAVSYETSEEKTRIDKEMISRDDFIVLSFQELFLETSRSIILSTY